MGVVAVSEVGVFLSEKDWKIEAYAIDSDKNFLWQKSFKWEDEEKIFALLPSSCTVYLAANRPSHAFAGKLLKRGVVVKQVPTQAIHSYLKAGNEGSYKNPQTILRAGCGPHVNYVPVKSLEQIGLKTAHLFRKTAIKSRISLMFQIWERLEESGVSEVESLESLEDYLKVDFAKDRRLNRLDKELIQQLQASMAVFDTNLEFTENQLSLAEKQFPVIKRLQTIPGIDLFAASVLVAISGDPKVYKNGRAFAARLGVDPSSILQICSDGLYGYVKEQLLNGAHQEVSKILSGEKNDNEELRNWVLGLWETRKDIGYIISALANKNARIAWRILTSDSAVYDQYMAHGKKVIQ